MIDIINAFPITAKHLENLKLGTENRLSELRNEMA